MLDDRGNTRNDSITVDSTSKDQIFIQCPSLRVQGIWLVSKIPSTSGHEEVVGWKEKEATDQAFDQHSRVLDNWQLTKTEAHW